MSWVKQLSKSLQEIRLIISPQTNPNSLQFAQKYVPLIRKDTNNFPFLVRECEGVDEHIIFRYKYGVE